MSRDIRLWVHSHPASTRMWEFKSIIEREHHVDLPDYEALRQWSIARLSDFWGAVWHFTRVRASAPFEQVIEDEHRMFPRPSFFPGARLNFAENLLYPYCDPPEDSFAIIAATETSRESVTWKMLRERVKQCTAALRAVGISSSDRVGGYLANHTNALVAMLATTSVGAIWTGVSPDTGVHAVLDRMVQIHPKLLFSDNAVLYNGKIHDVHAKLQEIVLDLPELHAVFIFETIKNHPFDTNEISVGGSNYDDTSRKAWMYEDFIADHQNAGQHCFEQLDPDHPIYILFSSGTTGRPKCITHGAIGTLIQHKKEHDIHCDIRPGDRFFQYTTTSWMMWHWLVSGLASGATLILYDGSPFRPVDDHGDGELAIPRLIEELQITHFGTSAKYLSLLEQKNILPKSLLSLKSLKAIYSTGSPLAPSTFEYVYGAFGPDINLGSITGGTDIISLFGAPSLISPVYSGEIQIRALGMAVEAWDFRGEDVTNSGEPGELVCVKPFPCQPVYFWGEEGQEIYEKSYFQTFPGIWHHGDFIKLNPKTGGLVMLGRSDGVLKPAGVRFGSAEIYNVLLKHFANVDDALCIGRRRETDTDETVVLFVKMLPQNQFSEELAGKIKTTIRSELSPRHVPSIVDECMEIPVTTNGKKIEIAVKNIISGVNVKTSASVANAECLDWYRRWNETH